MRNFKSREVIPPSRRDAPGSRNALLAVSQSFVDIFSYFDPLHRHYLLTVPLCRAYHSETALQIRTWRAFLLTEPLSVPSDFLQKRNRRDSQALHLRLSRNIFRLREGEVAVVADVMRSSRCCASIQMVAMERLNSLLEDENRRAVAQCGEIPSVLFEIMAAFMHDEALLARALYSVMLVLRPKGGSEGCLFKGDEMSSLHVPAVTERGVATVLACMRQHVSSRRLQYMGCWAMVNMALEGTHKAKLLELRAIDTVCAAMDAHTDDAKVQFRALFALINLVTVGGVSQTRSPHGAEELIARVVAVTRRFVHHLEVAGRGCMVLYNLSLDSSNHAFLQRCQVVDLLREASQLHPVDHMLSFVYTSATARLGNGHGNGGRGGVVWGDNNSNNNNNNPTTTTTGVGAATNFLGGRANLIPPIDAA